MLILLGKDSNFQKGHWTECLIAQLGIRRTWAISARFPTRTATLTPRRSVPCSVKRLPLKRKALPRPFLSSPITWLISRNATQTSSTNSRRMTTSSCRNLIQSNQTCNLLVAHRETLMIFTFELSFFIPQTLPECCCETEACFSLVAQTTVDS